MTPPIWKYYQTKKFRQLIKVFDDMNEIILPKVDKAVKRLEAAEHKNSDKSDRSVLEKLLEINKNIAVVMAFDMLMAGIDTVNFNLFTNKHLRQFSLKLLLDIISIDKLSIPFSKESI